MTTENVTSGDTVRTYEVTNTKNGSVKFVQGISMEYDGSGLRIYGAGGGPVFVDTSHSHIAIDTSAVSSAPPAVVEPEPEASEDE